MSEHKNCPFRTHIKLKKYIADRAKGQYEYIVNQDKMVVIATVNGRELKILKFSCVGNISQEQADKIVDTINT